jgi:hypothetical protein
MGFTTYAVLQTTIEPPPVAALERAFSGLKKFTKADAHIIANDAFGVLIKRLDAHDAAAFQGALRAQGIETELVPMSALPVMPPGKVVRRVDPLPDALHIFDPIGRSFPVEWKHVMLVAAGGVRSQEFVTRQIAVPRNPWTANQHEVPLPVQYEPVRREETVTKTMLEIVLARGVQRFSLEIGRASFHYLGAAAAREPMENFTTLVRDLLKLAPHALPNRGSFLLRNEPPQSFAYPSRNAFHEEIVWMLWKLGKVQR